MTFTVQKLRAIFPTTKNEVLETFVAPLNATCARFDISTVARRAAFIAQVGHESGNLTAMKENLNYGQSGLLKVFPKYFRDAATASRYARNPKAIANRVYANRMGNGDEASGDGYRYRGRGLIQITGSYNYHAFATVMKISVADACTYMETLEGAAMSAGWFWSQAGLNAMADQTRFTDITRRINGGVNGLAHRKELWALALKALA
jgi:putative chitinase